MVRSHKLFFVILSSMALVSLTCSLFSPEIASPPGTLPVSPTPAASPVLPSEAETGAEQAPEGESVEAVQAIHAVAGGEVRLKTARGDQVRLVIPPFALPQDSEIRLTALSIPPANPFQDDFFPGLQIEPDGLRLRLPATLEVALADEPPGAAARLFCVVEPDLALPLWQSQVQERSLSGKITHFSAYTGSAPSREEARTQVAAAAELGGDFPSNWQSSLEGSQGLSEWGSALNDMGLTGEGEAAINAARTRLEAELLCLMDPSCNTIPLDPCGEYQQMLMQMYQQATSLAFDPQSEAMSFLYDELQRVLNECTNRYMLEYSHKLRVNQGGLEQEIIVTGKVIFTAPMYGVFETGEPLKMEGSGPVDVSISGQMHVDDETCIIDGSGNNQVTIRGELVADEMGFPWLDLQVSESWYTSGEMTFSCPEDDTTKSLPLPAMAAQEYPLRFQYEDGAKSMAPNLGGMQGEYIWVLHIIHTW